MEESDLEQFANAATNMLIMLKPMIIERMITLQEDPETKFATVVGDEVMVDFERLFNGLYLSNLGE